MYPDSVNTIISVTPLNNTCPHNHDRVPNHEPSTVSKLTWFYLSYATYDIPNSSDGPAKIRVPKITRNLEYLRRK